MQAEHGLKSSLFLWTLSLAFGAALWQVASTLMGSVLFPSFLQTMSALLGGLASGELFLHVGASLQRVLLGWGIGAALGVPLGLAMGSFSLVRWMFEPVVNFLRFIPAIAWITPFTIWMGVGEVSKFALICYGSTFMVMINTMAGVYTVGPDKIRAARCFGANQLQIFAFVTLPATVPFIVTGLRVGLGNAFIMLISAEMLAAQYGLGFLIFNSRQYLNTDLIFVGMLTLGIIGLVGDLLLRWASMLLFGRYLAEAARR